MPKDQSSLHRRLFPTAHKVLLDRELDGRFPRLKGDVLVIGAGLVRYEDLLISADTVTKTDIGRMTDNIDSIVDAHEMQFEDSSYDSVVAIEVFEHLHSPTVAAGEMHRILRPGGQALVSLPFLFHVHGDPHDYQRLTKSGLEELFKEFTSVEVAGFGNRKHVISDIITTAAKFFAGLRIFNHLLAAGFLPNRPSRDCPSGYIVELVK